MSEVGYIALCDQLTVREQCLSFGSTVSERSQSVSIPPSMFDVSVSGEFFNSSGPTINMFPGVTS